MNKSAIQKFAIQARRDLLAQVKQQAYNYNIHEVDNIKDIQFIDDKALSNKELAYRNKIINEINKDGYDQVMERVAYTWFNRFIALRFMEINDYLPTHIRVLSNDNGEFKPEILNQAINISLEDDNGNNLLDKETLVSLINKADGKEELYRYLLITQCHSLSYLLPKMFERTDDCFELLFPKNILSSESVIAHLVNDIEEDDFKDAVEIIGWLYQYYNEERKNEVINIYKGVVAKGDIPAATQIFTTDWVVRYMVDNSLGRYWIERNPSSKLAEKLEFFMTPKNGEINYINERVTPQEMTFFDPCMGSGHILVYAFDVLLEIYVESGYTEREAVTCIIENNLFGLDIDTRAYQLAYFALMMKARSKNRKFLTSNISPQVYCPQDCDELENLGSTFIVDDLGVEPTEPQQLNLDNINWKKEQNNWNFKRLLTQKYAVVCTNPPYLNKYNPALKKYVTDNYKDYSADLFSVFIYKNFDYCKPNGYSAFMTPNVWMFIKTYEKLRKYLISTKSISSLVQIAKGAFYKEATVDVMAFVAKNRASSENGLYIRLDDFKGDMEFQKQKVLEALINKECEYYYETSKENFSKIPGIPIAYWISNFNIFNYEKIKESYLSGGRNKTHDNNNFVRNWWEVNDFEKWKPYANGGEFRRWYGNHLDVVDWSDSAIENYASHGGLYNKKFWNKKGICWNLITSYKNGFRIKLGEFHYSSGSPTIISDNDETDLITLGFLNTAVATYLIKMFNPTLNTTVNDVLSLPIDTSDFEEVIYRNTKNNILISKEDWDSFETSWDFERHPLISLKNSSTFTVIDSTARTEDKSNFLEFSYNMWSDECEQRFNNLKSNEEELNRIFIDIYGLQDELTSEVEDKDVTVRLADKTRDIKSFISYAVGCMFGRYSLDVDGLAYASGEFDSSKYTTFIPDGDNIIPICDDEYFEDDIVGRFIEFVKVVYGNDTLEVNLKFIADALGGKGTSREVIRNYFAKDFYKDHVKIYKKRPIYWQFESGKKNGFKALIYMHRYSSDLLARMRTDYVHEQQERYRTQITHIEEEMLVATPKEKTQLTKQHKKLIEQSTEIKVYEEKIHQFADRNISIDLDDGVVKNYAIFADVLSKLK